MPTLVAQMLRNLPAVQEAQVQSLGQEDPLEKRMATRSTILSWRIPWIEEPGSLQFVQFMGLQRVGHNRVTNTHIHTQTNTHTHTTFSAFSIHKMYFFYS